MKKYLFKSILLLLFTGTTLYPYITEIKTTTIGNKKVVFMADYHDDDGKKIAATQRDALKAFFKEHVFNKLIRTKLYLEAQPNTQREYATLAASGQIMQRCTTGDYLDVFYVNFHQGKIKDKFIIKGKDTGLDIASWDVRTILDRDVADSCYFLGVIRSQAIELAQQLGIADQESYFSSGDFFKTSRYKELKRNNQAFLNNTYTHGWFTDVCARLTEMTHFMTERYSASSALIKLIDQENESVIDAAQKLLTAISRDTHCNDFPRRLLGYMELSQLTSERLNEIVRIIFQLSDQASNMNLLQRVLTDEHPLILVHLGAAHVNRIQKYLEIMGYTVVSTHTGQPVLSGYYFEPLTPALITQALTQVIAH